MTISSFPQKDRKEAHRTENTRNTPWSAARYLPCGQCSCLEILPTTTSTLAVPWDGHLMERVIESRTSPGYINGYSGYILMSLNPNTYVYIYIYTLIYTYIYIYIPSNPNISWVWITPIKIQMKMDEHPLWMIQLATRRVGEESGNKVGNTTVNILPGWWFGTWLFFLFTGKNNPNWRTHIFQRGWLKPPTSNDGCSGSYCKLSLS